jgi:hypothetical protein
MINVIPTPLWGFINVGGSSKFDGPPVGFGPRGILDRSISVVGVTIPAVLSRCVATNSWWMKMLTYSGERIDLNGTSIGRR